ncbi:LuxR C-terminal-related transcriptional regulator [Agromyces sp. MMS24-JH15]|uniref:LuxR C-terminal-related transcriptional regulator n=1 Tax=Agromyces sp. MMS24-JH15 TaxID=3243765 RepID=UPI003747EBCE
MDETSAPIRVAIVDDHRMFLEGLTHWLRDGADDIDLVAAVPAWSELLAHPEFPVDVVLLDLDLKDNIPVPIKLSMLKTAGVRTTLISTYSEPALVREALNGGALGYVPKAEPASTMLEAIRAAHDGRVFLTAELQATLTTPSVVPRLSSQERRVMALYASGLPVKKVAFELGISEETAKSYLKRIREKYRLAGFDVGTKVALRKRAQQDGILLLTD